MIFKRQHTSRYDFVCVCVPKASSFFAFFFFFFFICSFPLVLSSERKVNLTKADVLPLNTFPIIIALLLLKFEETKIPQGEKQIVQCITLQKDYNKYSPGLEGEDLGQKAESYTLLSQDSL